MNWYMFPANYTLVNLTDKITSFTLLGGCLLHTPLKSVKMIDDNKILTLHPQGKKGVNILRRRYELIKDYILATIEKHKEITYEDLGDLAIEELSETFDGKVLWYIVTVKLDLEARGIIERIPKTSPHKLRMK